MKHTDYNHQYKVILNVLETCRLQSLFKVVLQELETNRLQSKLK